MKNILLVTLLAASPAWAQIPLTPKAAPKAAARAVDNCAPIGKTAKGELVYSMKCDNLPAPPPQAEAREAAPAAAPEPEVQRSGVFGWSYDRRQ
ncbi:hypothetical protein [Afipia sp. GAS231]|uniref:hypothetical protein n=1 Tax=Afipia sp. GAS231 TaxID=1882747 RepID=UPI00087A0D90|nr:hypothetical protein [Afipia sp. GAS231]SDP04654.1 hypothetical protein SAMN05444050_5693 [Afipia sp. GAS231]